jgi:hypothetical protein
MNMLNVVQKLALITLTVFLYSSTFLCAATAAPVSPADHNVALYNTTTLDLDVTFQINNDGHFGDPIRLAPKQLVILSVALTGKLKNCVCFKIAKADKEPFAIATLTAFGTGLDTKRYTTCIAIYLQTEGLTPAHPDYLKHFHTIRTRDGDWNIRPKPFFHDSAENRGRTAIDVMTKRLPRSDKDFETIFRVHRTSFDALTPPEAESESAIFSAACREKSTARPTITIY